MLWLWAFNGEVSSSTLLIKSMFMCRDVVMWLPQRMYRGERLTFGGCFSPFTMWVPGIKIRLQAWQQAPLPMCWAIFKTVSYENNNKKSKQLVFFICFCVCACLHTVCLHTVCTCMGCICMMMCMYIRARGWCWMSSFITPHPVFWFDNLSTLARQSTSEFPLWLLPHTRITPTPCHFPGIFCRR